MTQPETKTYKWAHHTKWDGKDVLPGDPVEMTPDQARGYIVAGMLQVDPENPVQVAEALGEPLPPSPVDLNGNVADITSKMAALDDAGIQAVIAAEKAGRGRAGIVEYTKP